MRKLVMVTFISSLLIILTSCRNPNNINTKVEFAIKSNIKAAWLTEESYPKLFEAGNDRLVVNYPDRYLLVNGSGEVMWNKKLAADKVISSDGLTFLYQTNDIHFLIRFDENGKEQFIIPNLNLGDVVQFDQTYFYKSLDGLTVIKFDQNNNVQWKYESDTPIKQIDYVNESGYTFLNCTENNETTLVIVDKEGNFKNKIEVGSKDIKQITYSNNYFYIYEKMASSSIIQYNVKENESKEMIGYEKIEDLVVDKDENVLIRSKMNDSFYFYKLNKQGEKLAEVGPFKQLNFIVNINPFILIADQKIMYFDQQFNIKNSYDVQGYSYPNYVNDGSILYINLSGSSDGTNYLWIDKNGQLVFNKTMDTYSFLELTSDNQLLMKDYNDNSIIKIDRNGNEVMKLSFDYVDHIVSINQTNLDGKEKTKMVIEGIPSSPVSYRILKDDHILLSYHYDSKYFIAIANKKGELVMNGEVIDFKNLSDQLILYLKYEDQKISKVTVDHTRYENYRGALLIN